MMKQVRLLLLILLLLMGTSTVHAETNTTKILDLEQLPKDDEVSFFERTVAALITAVPNALIKVLGMQDIDSLVFGKNDLVYSTFTSGFWKIASAYFNIAEQLTGSLLLIAFTAWGLIFQLRSANPISRSNFRDMTEGIMIFVGAMWTASFIIDTIFTVNHYFVRFAMAVLTKFNIPTDMKFLDLVVALQNTPSVGGALIFLLVVVSVGILNYQYAFRMLALVFMLALFPGAAYASIYPWSRKAMDTWLREFVALVFENAGHAFAFSIFLAAIHNGAGNWVLFAFLFGFTQLASMIRIVVGAPISGSMMSVGGNLGTMFGMGSMMSMQRLVQNMKGASVHNQMGKLNSLNGHSLSANSNGLSPVSANVAADTPAMPAGLSVRSGGLGVVGNPKNGGLVKDGLKAGAKAAAYGTAGVAGALVTGALTGNPGTAIAGFEMGVRSVNAGRKIASAMKGTSPIPSSKPPSTSPDTAISRPTILSREVQSRYAGRRFQISPESRNELMGRGQIGREQLIQRHGVNGSSVYPNTHATASDPRIANSPAAGGIVKATVTTPLGQIRSTTDKSAMGNGNPGPQMTTREQLLGSLTVPSSSIPSQRHQIQKAAPTGTDTAMKDEPKNGGQR